jgi:hypothetical protein
MKKLFFSTCLLFVGLVVSAQDKKLSPEEVVQLQTDKYNVRDIDGFMAEFSSDVKIYDFRTGVVTDSSFEEIRKKFKGLFDASPNLHSSTVKSIAFDNVVIVHERVDGRKGSATPIDLVFIATVENEKIVKVAYIRKA